MISTERRGDDQVGICPWPLLVAIVGLAIFIGVGYGTAELCNAEPNSIEASCDNGPAVVRAAIALFAVHVIGMWLFALRRWRWICVTAVVAQLVIICTTVITFFQGAGDVKLW